MKTAIVETLAAHYGGRITVQIRRKSAEHARLAALDLFALDEAKAKWTQRRMAEIEEELLLLNDCLHMADAFREAWDEQSNARAAEVFWWARREYEFAARQARDYRELYIETLGRLEKQSENFITAYGQLRKKAA